MADTILKLWNLCTRSIAPSPILNLGNRLVDLFPIRSSNHLINLAFSTDNETTRKSLVRVGTIAFLTSGILLVLWEITVFLFTFNFLRSETSSVLGGINAPEKIVTVLITPVQLPTTTGAIMTFIADNASSFLLAYTFAGLGSVVLLIAIPALYVCFRKYSPASIILGCIVALVSVIAEAVTAGNSFSLITASVNFAAATTDFQRAAYVAVYQSTLNGVLINSDAFAVIQDLAFLVISTVMLRSPMPKWVAILGITISIFGIFASIVGFLTSELNLTQISQLLFAAWFFALAYNLRRSI